MNTLRDQNNKEFQDIDLMLEATTAVELSLVIPVYNGSDTVGRVVADIHQVCANLSFEIVLVNDGSADNSEAICRRLVEQHPKTTILVQLARNFGEHNAVLAGLRATVGQYVVVLDDDGQNPPSEAIRLLEAIRTHKQDVVYGKFVEKRHNFFRNIGSWFNDRMANYMLKKPPEIYLSSFKVIDRFVVDEIINYHGPFPYIDGLIYRTTRNIGQIEVQHADRLSGSSGYTLRKLVALWLNMFLGFSITPLRISVGLGMVSSVFSALMFFAIIIDKLWFTKNLTMGIPTVLCTIVFFAGAQLIVLGTLGEYIGRIFLDQNGLPQYVVRYTKGRDADACEMRTLYDSSAREGMTTRRSA